MVKAPPITVVKTKSEAEALALLLNGQEIVAVDTEYQPGDVHTGKVIVWSVCWDENKRAVIMGELLPHFKAWLGDASKKKVFQNAHADIRVLENKVQAKLHGKIHVRGFHCDTMVTGWLVDENRLVGLKERAREDLHVSMKDFEDVFSYVPAGKVKPVLVGIDEMLKTDPERVYDYASKDAWCTYLLYQKDKAELDRIGLWDYYLSYKHPFLKLLWSMQEDGILLNRGYVADIFKRLEKRCKMMVRMFRQRAVEETGCVDFTDINPRSGKQLQRLFFDELKWPVLSKTESDNPSLDKDTLDDYVVLHDKSLAKLLSALRSSNTMLSNFVGPMLAAVDYSTDGRVRTEFNIIGADTGRISSRKEKALTEEGKKIKIGMQLQNIPADPAKDVYTIRRAFIAEKGKKLVVLDYSQVELRILAHYSQDATMMDAYNSKPEKDLHSITAVAIAKARGQTGCKLPDFANKAAVKVFKERWGDERRDGKATNFATAYGAQAYTIAQRLGCSLEEATKILANFYATYPGVRKWQEATIADCKDKGYVTTLAGRRRRLPDVSLHIPRNITKDAWKKLMGKQSHAERQAVNTPIQGSAADIMERAMLRIASDARFRATGAKMLLQVHDELVFEADEKSADKVLKICKEIMESVGKEFQLRVPLVAEGAVGDNWADAKH